MNSSDIKSVPALGRQFELGMLYDNVNEKPVEGNLWAPSEALSTVLQGNVIEIPKPSTKSDVLIDKSMRHKFEALEVEAGIVVGLLLDLIMLRQSGKYLLDKTSTEKVHRVTFRYSARTKTDQLDGSMLEGGKMTGIQEAIRSGATHVVSGIEFGADAFMTFVKRFSLDEEHHRVESNGAIMDALLNGIAAGVMDASGIQKDKKLDDTTFHYNGDFELPVVPTSVPEALEICQDFPHFLGKSGENALPKLIHLYPLAKFSWKAKRSYELLPGNCEKIENVINTLQQQLTSIDDLVVGTEDRPLQAHLHKDLLAMKCLLAKFLDGQKTKLRPMVIDMKKGLDSFGKPLNDQLKAIECGPFRESFVANWLKFITEECGLLTNYSRIVTGLKIFQSQKELDEKLLSENSRKTGSLTVLKLTFRDMFDPYLFDCKKYDLESCPKDRTKGPVRNDWMTGGNKSAIERTIRDFVGSIGDQEKDDFAVCVCNLEGNSIGATMAKH